MKEKLIEISTDDKFNMEDVSAFWQKSKIYAIKKYRSHRTLSFSTTYLCEVSFLILTELKNKNKNVSLK